MQGDKGEKNVIKVLGAVRLMPKRRNTSLEAEGSGVTLGARVNQYGMSFLVQLLQGGKGKHIK